MKKIFVSYRRDDTAGHSGRLFDKLSEAYGVEYIFMDIDGIAPGQNFQHVLASALSSAGAVIAVIGRDWIGVRSGGNRIDDGSDYVRMEIATALKRRVPIIPVLVHGASMPKPAVLPADIAPIAQLHALEITDARWPYDVRTLIEALDFKLGFSRPAITQEKGKRGGCAKFLLVLAAIVAGFFTVLWGILAVARGPDQVPFGIMAAVAAAGAILAVRKLTKQ